LPKTFKSRGYFDSLRKDLFTTYVNSEQKSTLITSLQSLAEAEIEKDPGLLDRNRAKAALLLDGVVEREKEVYKGVEGEIDDMLMYQRRRVEELVRGIL
ncbi:hypothetical protein L211DRAFT_774867, partial [Terfezia boudieri ATCC MYA-4762]